MTFSNSEIAAHYIERLLRKENEGELPEWYHPAKVQEEAGEVWRAFLRLSTPRGDLKDYAEELADTVISAYAAAQDKGLDLDYVIQNKHAALMSRDIPPPPPIMEDWPREFLNIPNDLVDSDSKYQAAIEFLKAVGLTPNVDAVEQLADAFIPCLQIICERGYHPGGATWRRAGRKGLVREILKNTDRIHDKDWLGNIHDADSGHDLINYAGYYTRALEEGLDNWGFWGEPAQGEGNAQD